MEDVVEGLVRVGSITIDNSAEPGPTQTGEYANMFKMPQSNLIATVVGFCFVGLLKSSLASAQDESLHRFLRGVLMKGYEEANAHTDEELKFSKTRR